MLKIQELFDLTHTLAGAYLSQFTYPWEALGGIKELILALGPALEAKGYVAVSRSRQDARALKVELTQKAYQYLADYDEPLANETNRLFLLFSDEEIESFVSSLKKLRQSLENYEEGE